MANERERKKALEKETMKQYLAQVEAEDKARRNRAIEDFVCNVAGSSISLLIGSQTIPYAYNSLVDQGINEKGLIMAGVSLACLAGFAKCAYEAGRYAWHKFAEKKYPDGFITMEIYLRDKYPDATLLID